MDINLLDGALDLALNDRDGVIGRAFATLQTFYKQSTDEAARRAAIPRAIAVLQNAAALYDQVVAAKQEVADAIAGGTDLTIKGS